MQNIQAKHRTISEIESSLSTMTDDSVVNTDKKIAVILHLYYLDLINEMLDYLDSLDNITFDLYVTLVKTTDNEIKINRAQKTILSIYPNTQVFIIKNRGLDIGGFLHVADYMIKNDLQYDYLIKMHGKKSIHTSNIIFGNNWRKELLNTILGSDKIVYQIMRLMNNEQIGLVGSKTWHIKLNDPEIFRLGHNALLIQNIVKIFKLKVSISDVEFIAGSMFWARYDTLITPLKNIDLTEFINTLEAGACNDAKFGTKTHSMERIFGLLVKENSKIIVGI